MIEFPQRAMILAAGLGTRMQPLTLHLPKPLVEVAGKKLIDYALEFLRTQGVQEIIVNTSYLAQLLEDYLQHYASQHRLRIQISREESPLETGGGIARALPMLGDAPFFVVLGDVICLDPLNEMLQYMANHFDPETMDALLLLHPVSQAVGYRGAGDFFLEPTGQIKRRGEAVQAPYLFTGVQLLHPRLFARPLPEKFSMNLLYDLGKTAAGVCPRTFGMVHTGQWLDSGDLAARDAAEAFLTHRS